MTGSGRLADDGGLHARRAAVLRGHLLPEGAPRRDDRLRRALRAHRRALAHAARRPARASRPAHRRARSHRPRRPRRRRAHRRRGRRGLPPASCARPIPSSADWAARRSSRSRWRWRRWPSRPSRGDRQALAALTLTLDAMAAGGIYDHIGGGFARYAVDGVWLVPHFEKMLYDNALLIRLYLHGWQLTGEERFRQVLTETVDYVLRDLRQPGGGIVSAEDADSEGVEGKFYVWTRHRGPRGPRRASRRRPPLVRLPTRRQLRARHHDPEPDARAWRAGPPAGGRGGPRGALRGTRRPGSAPGSTTRCSPSGTPTSSRRSPRRARRRVSRPGSTRPWRRPSSCSPTCGARTVAGCGPGKPTPAPATSPTPPTTARWSTRSPASPRPPARPGGSHEARTSRRRAARAVLGPRARRCVHHRPRRRALITRPKDLMDNATPGANGLAAVGPAAAGGPHRRRSLPRARRGRRPPARRAGRRAARPPSATSLAAADLVARGTDRDRGGGRSARPPRGRRGRVPAHRGPRVGRAVRQPAVGGPRRRPRLRVPLRTPASSPRRPPPSSPRSSPSRSRRITSSAMSSSGERLPTTVPMMCAHSADRLRRGHRRRGPARGRCRSVRPAARSSRPCSPTSTDPRAIGTERRLGTVGRARRRAGARADVEQLGLATLVSEHRRRVPARATHISS